MIYMRTCMRKLKRLHNITYGEYYLTVPHTGSQITNEIKKDPIQDTMSLTMWGVNDNTGNTFDD